MLWESVLEVRTTHGILDNAEFLEALAQTVVVCVPGKTARKLSAGALDILIYGSYPMKSLDILMEMGEKREIERGEGECEEGHTEPDLKYNPGRNNITPQIFPIPRFSGSFFIFCIFILFCGFCGFYFCFGFEGMGLC